jgi:hypothetical protein
LNKDHPRPQLGSSVSYLPRTIEEEIPPLFRARDLEILPNERVYRQGECTVRLRSDDNGHALSISHPDRYPTWDEVTEAKYRLIPKVNMAMPLPAPEEYLNLAPYMFNLFEMKGEW